MLEKSREKIALLRLNLDWRWNQLVCAWKRRAYGRDVLQKGDASLVLVPCEPWTVMGSRGDEAMIYSILQHFRERRPEGRITIITGSETSFAASDDGQRLQRDFNANVVYAWRPRWYLTNLIRTIRTVRATEVYVLGADCMDGKWGTSTSTILFATADLAARLGIATRLTAFSWNEHPTSGVLQAIKHLTPRLPILVRDPVSYARFAKRFPRAHALSVADIAFNLKPSFTPAVTHELDWMAEDRKKGRFILGFNLHPMLVAKEELPALIERVAQALCQFLSSYPTVTLALIPHDYRTGGDPDVLSRVHQRLLALIEQSEQSNIRTIFTLFSAAELKALTSGLDALFTSRMHLGIAALGLGKPIASFAYQGKFAGLFERVGLPQDIVLPPDATPEALNNILSRLVADAPSLQRSVAEKLPTVFQLAKASFTDSDLSVQH